jgi:hypothetical protein
MIVASVCEDVLRSVGASIHHLGLSVVSLGQGIQNLAITARLVQYDASRDYRNVSGGELAMPLGFPQHLSPPEAESLPEYNAELEQPDGD